MFRKILFGASLVLMAWDVKCNHNCDQLGVLLYDEIGCKPVKDQPDDLCPSRYDCSHLEEKGEHCFFRGKKYKNREGIPDDALHSSCNGGCFCEAAYSPSFNFSFSKFTCAAFDCPEFLGGSPLNNIDCIRTYTLTGCCSSGQICPPFENITTCKVGEHTFKEGQRFSIEDSCSTCICQEGFSGKFEASFCKRHTCVVELRHADDIRQHCAPIYLRGPLCCPFSWACPSETDIFSPAKKNDTTAKTCKFGERDIKSGQVLKKTVEKYGKKYEVKCDCQLPPLLTCVVEN